jgi:ubiquinone biosynthesis protein UbiJ
MMRYNLLRDGRLVLSGTQADLMRFVHLAHCFSFDWAIRFAGYSVEVIVEGDK